MQRNHDSTFTAPDVFEKGRKSKINVKINKYLKTGKYDIPSIEAWIKQEEEKQKKFEEDNKPKITESSTFLPVRNTPSPKITARISKL